MTWTDESLRDFGWQIQKLIERQDLTRRESYDMFRQVLLNRQPEIQQGAFLAALVSKNETPPAGSWGWPLERLSVKGLLTTAPV